MRIASVLVSFSLCAGVAQAAESCQALIDQVAAGVAAADQLATSDRPAKCRAYSHVASDLGSVATACSASQSDLDLAKDRFPPLARRVADGEKQYCGN